MRAIDHNTITDAAIEQMASTPDPRLREDDSMGRVGADPSQIIRGSH
jgi:hypothetical protein